MKYIREAFQSKNQRNLGISPNRGGSSKNQKSPKFQLGIVQNQGGVFGNQKSPKFQRVPKTNKMMTHFHIMRTKKHKMLSIVVLNMAKYTIISLILTDFVPIFFIFNLFRKNFRGSFRFKKVPSPKLILGGGSTHFKKVPSSKKSQPLQGGGSCPLWTNSQVWLLFRLESFPKRYGCISRTLH